MKNNWIFGAGMVLCLGIGGLAVYQKMINDRQAPVIYIENDMVYQDGMQAELLEGVTAKDEQDGDVTASLVVETITPDAKNKTAVILYAARDKSNNIAKKSYVAEYLPSEKTNSEEAETEAEEVKDEKQEAETSKTNRTEVGLGAGLGTRTEGTGKDSAKKEIEEAIKEDAETEETTELESETEELEPGCPVLKLTELSTTIKVGETFNPIIYVASIEDDYDNIYELWQDIQISGEYDTEKAGTYELTFYVVDSAENMSNQAKLVLKVEEE